MVSTMCVNSEQLFELDKNEMVKISAHSKEG